jgi:CBS domain containing-hemolysin-like protein
MLKNLFTLRKKQIREVMTPRTVLFTLPESTTVAAFVKQYPKIHFSRVPVYGDDPDHVNGFVRSAELLLAWTRGEADQPLSAYRRDLPALPESLTIAQAFNLLMAAEAHIALVVDEYGDLQGILTLEDVLETVLGLEIVDEGDLTADMQELARQRWKSRAGKLGVEE